MKSLAFGIGILFLVIVAGCVHCGTEDVLTESRNKSRLNQEIEKTYSLKGVAYPEYWLGVNVEILTLYVLMVHIHVLHYEKKLAVKKLLTQPI